MEFTRIIEKQKEVIEAVRARNIGSGFEVESWEELENLTFAFHVELMELANEVGFFKHWKQSHEPDRATVLEELVDCFAFLMHVAIIKGYVNMFKGIHADEFMVENADLMSLFFELKRNNLESSGQTIQALYHLVLLTAKLGFTDVELEQAYMDKSEKNIKRQKEGY